MKVVYVKGEDSDKMSVSLSEKRKMQIDAFKVDFITKHNQKFKSKSHVAS